MNGECSKCGRVEIDTGDIPVFTIRKPIVNQGHAYSINLTKECKLYGISLGDIVEITVKKV